MKVCLADVIGVENNMTRSDISSIWSVTDKKITSQAPEIDRELTALKELEDAVSSSIEAYKVAKIALDIRKASLGITDIPTAPIVKLSSEKNLATYSLVGRIKNTYVEV